MSQTRAQELLKFYDDAGVKDKITQGANTPWPNRAEAAVKLFKKHAEILIDSLRRQGHLDKDWKRFTVQEIFQEAVKARNFALTYGGRSPYEIAWGIKPPDVIDIEHYTPGQMTTEPRAPELHARELQRLAREAHLRARQSEDLRRDLATRLQASTGPIDPGLEFGTLIGMRTKFGVTSGSRQNF